MLWNGKISVSFYTVLLKLFWNNIQWKERMVGPIDKYSACKQSVDSLENSFLKNRKNLKHFKFF